MERNTGLESSNGQMELYTLGSFSTTTSMEEDSTPGLTNADMRVSGGQIECMAKVALPGQTAESFVVCTLTTRKKATESSSGQTKEGTEASGSTESSTGVEHIPTLTGRRCMENGRMEYAFAGSTVKGWIDLNSSIIDKVIILKFMGTIVKY